MLLSDGEFISSFLARSYCEGVQGIFFLNFSDSFLRIFYPPENTFGTVYLFLHKFIQNEFEISKFRSRFHFERLFFVTFFLKRLWKNSCLKCIRLCSFCLTFSFGKKLFFFTWFSFFSSRSLTTYMAIKARENPKWSWKLSVCQYINTFTYVGRKRPIFLRKSPVM